ncbi:MAG TPA: glycine--tRNA ligase subunit beta [Thermoanaerobaculia bacterium]|nr:glycine--tRNA ligase subunit beta [Thermoanaerobaculia bacterium]
MSSQDFVFEIRTEEIPAPVLLPARLELARRLADGMAEEGLTPAAAESYATPRRLAVVLRGIPERQPDRSSEVLGPPAANAFDADGKPTKAAEGFARAQKVDVAELVVVDSPRGRTVAARRTIPGRSAEEVLGEVVPRVVAGLTFPKTMRWGAGDRAFVRPVRSVVAVYGGRVVAMDVLGLAAGNVTAGHRILSDGEIRVTSPEDYLEGLRRAFVEPDAEARRLQILEKARRLASEVGGQIEAHADLANTLSDLVEWPGLVRGAFAPEFLELPEEITVTAMRTHQKYVPVRGPAGLLPHFLAVMDNTDDPKGFVAKGCEWVLNARLADARFFFEADVQERLEARLPGLEHLTFQDRLGDYRRKTARIEEIAEAIARLVGRADLVETVRTAARLSKADLTTLVVKEFTDLQGVMGGIYARRERQPDGVWKAIYDQYRPASGSDDPPREASGAILSLADRFDSLASLFRIGLVPTGSRDPYGLRRAALGAVAIAIGRNWRTDWRPIVRQALALLPADLKGPDPDAVVDELGRFFADRVRSLLERRGHTYDEISAVLNVGVWDFADAADRARALSDARRHMDFRALILAFKRIRNIVGGDQPGAPRPELYREDAERVLAADFLQARQAISGFVAERHYREAMETIASIAPSLDRYFVDVLVNAPEEDLRKNRLALLASIQKEFTSLADFSEIVVEK